SDQQNETDSSEEDHQRWAHILHHCFANCVGAETVVRLHPNGIGKPTSILFGGNLKLRSRHPDRYSGLESSQRQKVMDLIIAIGINLEGNPNLRRNLSLRLSAGRHDADHFIRSATKRDGLTQNAGVTAEMSLPKS